MNIFSLILVGPAQRSCTSRGKCVAQSSGESGIRTHGTLLEYTRFPSVLLQPLGHLSNKKEPQR